MLVLNLIKEKWFGCLWALNDMVTLLDNKREEKRKEKKCYIPKLNIF